MNKAKQGKLQTGICRYGITDGGGSRQQFHYKEYYQIESTLNRTMKGRKTMANILVSVATAVMMLCAGIKVL